MTREEIEQEIRDPYYSVTVDTATDTGMMFINATDQTTIIPVVNEQKQAEKPISIKEIEKDTKLTKEEWVKIQIELGRRKRKKRQERARDIDSPFSIIISSDMMVITFGYYLDYTVITTDTNNKRGTTRDVLEKYATDRTSGYNLPVLISDIYFDKNMTPLSLDYNNSNGLIRSGGMFTGINLANLDICPSSISGIHDRYIVIDKKRFIESRGRDFRIKFRHDVRLTEVLAFKKQAIKIFDDAETLANRIKAVVSNIYDEENFEIVYRVNFRGAHNKFAIFVQFPDLVVRNSIEMEHKIHNIIAIMEGYYYEADKMNISRGLKGIRTKYNPKDAYYGYNHSHLPAGIISFPASFCMGSDHFLSHISGYVSDLELESLLVAMFDHISWESLEGGPYFTMESIGNSSRYSRTPELSSVKLESYDRPVIDDIIKELNTKDLSNLFNSFELTLNEQKNITYNINYNVFFKLFISLLDEEFVKNIVLKHSLTTYSYNPNGKVFYRSNTGGLSGYHPLNNEALIEGAREKIKRIAPIYFNGKYILPELVEKDTNETIEKEIMCFDPDLMVVIAKYIHYLLLTELKNERRK